MLKRCQPYKKFTLWVIVLLLSQFAFSQTEDELKEKADAFFAKEEFVEATPLYLRLLSLKPRDHNYNYRYGTCLLFNSDRKQDAFKYLNYAVKGKAVEQEAFYYLGKAFHLTFEFNKAIEFYKRYKEVAGSRAAMHLDVDRQIEMAQNGKKLLSRLSELIIESRRLTAFQDFFRLYDLSNIGGTLLVTEEFQTKQDKKNNHTPLIHFPANPTQIYYSSYGEDGKHGKDIYVRRKLPDGSWGLPQKVRGGVNTNYDEDFPYMHPNGRFLYFSSKGHNSMGGYDVFRAPYFPDDDSFGDAENMDFAISSPDDDLFYVIDSLDKNAFFASARQSQDGKIHVYKMRVQRSPDQMVILKGQFASAINPENKSASIQVRDVASGRKIGSYTSNKTDGGYIVTLPKGGRYEYIIQVEGEPDQHTAEFQAPFMTELKPLKQSIVEYEENGDALVRVDNLFDEEIEDAASIVAEILKNKAQLKPNSDAFDLDALDKLEDEKKLLSQLNLDRYNSTELKDIAQEDVERLELEAKEIDQELNKLLMVAEQALQQAATSDSLADLLLQQAATSENLTKGETLIEQAIAEKNTVQREIRKAEQAMIVYEEMRKEQKFNEQYLNQSKEVADVLSDVSSDNLKDKVNQLARNNGEYIKKHFNTSNKQSAAQLLYSKTEEKSGISEANQLRNEVQKLEETIRKRNEEIQTLEKTKEFSKKKDIEIIDREIDRLQTDNRADEELISSKQREIAKESTKENELIAKKSAIDKTRDITDSEISNTISHDQISNRIVASSHLADQERIDSFVETTTTVQSELKQRIEQSANSSENITTNTETKTTPTTNNSITTNSTTQENNSDLSSQSPTSKQVATINPRLKEQENNLISSDKTPEEKAKERLAIEKQWVFELSKEINRKETERQNSSSAEQQKAITAEITQLKEELAAKKQYIEELKPIGDPPGEEEVIAEAIIATIAPDYTSKNSTSEKINNVPRKLKSLNENDRDLVKKLEEHLQSLDNTSSEEAVTQKKVLEEKISELEQSIKDRENMLVLLGEAEPEVSVNERENTPRELIPFGGSETLKERYTNISSRSDASMRESIVQREHFIQEAEELAQNLTSEIQNDPANQQLQNELQGLQQTIANVETEIKKLRETEQQESFAAREKKISQLSTEIQTLSDDFSRLSESSTTEKELDQQIEERTILLNKVRKLLTVIDNELRDEPENSRILAKRNEVTALQADLEEEIKTLNKAKVAAYQTETQVSQQTTVPVSDAYSTEIASTREELERMSNSATIEQRLQKEKELVSLLEKALDENASNITKHPDNEQLLQQKSTLSDLHAQIEARIREHENQLTISTDTSTPSNNQEGITDKRVVELQQRIQQIESTQNPEDTDLLLSTKKELLTAIDEAIERAEKKRSNEVENSSLQEEISRLTTLKSKTENEVNELEQIRQSENLTAGTPENFSADLSRNQAGVADLFETSDSDPSEDQLMNRKSRLEDYLETLQEKKQKINDPVQQDNIQKEISTTETQLKTIDRLLSEMQVTYQPNTTNVSVNPEIRNNQEKVATSRAEIASLTTQLEQATTNKERKQLVKQLEKAEKKNLELEQELLFSQKEELASTSRELSENESSDAVVNASSVLLDIKTRETLQDIEQVKNSSSKKEKISLVKHTIEQRNQLEELQQQQQTRINETEIEQTLFTNEERQNLYGTEEEEYLLLQLKEEQKRIQLELFHLKKEFDTASKKRRPSIEVEISNMTAEYDRLTEEITKLEETIGKNQSIHSKPPTLLDNLTVSSTETTALQEDKEIIRIAQKKGYRELSNDINTLQLLERRRENLILELAGLKSQLSEVIQQAAQSVDDSEKEQLLAKGKLLSQKANDANNQLITTIQEIEELNRRIEENPLLINEEKDVLISMALEGIQPIRLRPVEKVYVGLNYNSGNSVYSPSNPIPINPEMPGGLVYKVQVGAFSKPVPEDTFKEFNPVTGEQINKGLIRYTVGIFPSKGEAYLAQNRVRSLGYSDAFVVAYCNGERMTVAQADRLIKEGKCTPSVNTDNTEGEELLAVHVTESSSTSASPRIKSTYHLAPDAAVADAVEDVKGLFFTVQVGVYNYPIPSSKLYNITPLNTNLSDKGQIRYSTGKFDDIPSAVNRRNEIRKIGISDAFVTAYYNGTRITISEAKKLIDESGESILYSNTVQQEVDTEEGETTIVRKPQEDNRKKLNPSFIRKTGISKETYTYYPSKELDVLRKSGIWAYYDQQSQRIKTIPSSSSDASLKSFTSQSINLEEKTTYKGFIVDEENGLFYESLNDVNPEKSYHSLRITWEGEATQLLGTFLTKNTYTILEWDPDEKTIVFGPLDFSTKEELKKELKMVPLITTEEKLLDWE